MIVRRTTQREYRVFLAEGVDLWVQPGSEGVTPETAGRRGFTIFVSAAGDDPDYVIAHAVQDIIEVLGET